MQNLYSSPFFGGIQLCSFFCIFKIVFSLYFHSIERNWFQTWFLNTETEQNNKKKRICPFQLQFDEENKTFIFDIPALIAARGELTKEKKISMESMHCASFVFTFQIFNIWLSVFLFVVLYLKCF